MTREDIIAMARETGVEWLMHNQFYKDHLQHFAALVAAAEREACAKHAEDFLTKGRSPLGRAVGEAIRARGETK